MWRGFTTNKNILGQIGVVSVILCYILYKHENLLRGKIIALGMSFLAIVFTVGSQSSTSFLAVLFLFGFGTVLSIDAVFKPMRIGRTISFIIIMSFLILIVGIISTFPEVTTIVPELFGKDSSFSGRSDLWTYLLTFGIRKINPLIGAGYGAYWVPESDRISSLYDVFIWLPNQSHNGYIDVFLATGYIGLILLIMILGYYFINFIKVQKPHPWFLFILVSIMINFQEATLLRFGKILNFIFMFSYLLLFVDKYKKFNWDFKFKSKSKHNL